MRKSNFDIAYAYVRQRILSGHYRPGQALVAKPLAAAIGVSRTPIHDALRQLETDGLVTFEVRIGASVKRMGVKEFKEMCEIRLALESHAAALTALHHTPDELKAIHAPLAAMRQITGQLGGQEREDEALREALTREDVRFHMAIIIAAKNDLIKKEILRLQLIKHVVAGPISEEEKRQVLPKAEQNEHRRLVMVGHDAIYRAIEQRQGGEAREAMARHLQGIIEGRLVSMSRANSGVFARQLSEDENVYLT